MRICTKLSLISSQQMMGVFATGRKAQNYYHYLSMTNSCYFDMLTTNTQVFRSPLLLFASSSSSMWPSLYIDWWHYENSISEKADAAKDVDLLFLECGSLVLWPQCNHCSGSGTPPPWQHVLVVIIMTSSPAGGLDWDGHWDEGLPHPQPPRPAGQANTKLLRRDLRCPLGY